MYLRSMFTLHFQLRYFFFLYASIHVFLFFFFSSRRRHTRLVSDWSSDVCSSDLPAPARPPREKRAPLRRYRAFRLGQADRFHRRQSAVRRPSSTPRLGRRAIQRSRSEERRVGKECRSRWSAYQ